jgi:signal transduction histidine kinase
VVEDDGAGIPEAVQARVFEPFFTTKESGKGTGLGLAIARGIVVDRHQGDIRLESKPGSGTRFFVRLPIAAMEGPESERL